MSHFPGTFHLGRKDRLWWNISRMMTRFGLDDFQLMPRTYILPRDLKRLKAKMLESGEQLQLILKPVCSVASFLFVCVQKSRF